LEKPKEEKKSLQDFLHDVWTHGKPTVSSGFRLGLGGHSPPVLLQVPPPQFRGHPRFFAKITQNLISLSYQILEKWPSLQLSLNAEKPKVLQLQGGFAP